MAEEEQMSMVGTQRPSFWMMRPWMRADLRQTDELQLPGHLYAFLTE